MKAVFYPVGGRKVASSRCRAWLLCDRREEFFIGRGPGSWRKADAVVVQKRCDTEARRILQRARRAGGFVVLDWTDVYLAAGAGLGARIASLAQHAHALTCSNPDDMKLLAGLTGRTVAVIRNCQDMTAYPLKKVHRPRRKPVVVWCGHSNNKDALKVMWPALRSLAAEGVRFEVLLISNDSGIGRGLHIDEKHPVWFQKWKLKEVNAVMLRGDVAVNPQTRKGDGRWHKDRNKTVTAWACGLPCVDFKTAGTDHGRWRGQLRKLLADHELRAERGKRGIVRARYWGVAPVSEVWLGLLKRGAKRVGS